MRITVGKLHSEGNLSDVDASIKTKIIGGGEASLQASTFALTNFNDRNRALGTSRVSIWTSGSSAAASIGSSAESGKLDDGTGFSRGSSFSFGAIG